MCLVCFEIFHLLSLIIHCDLRLSSPTVSSAYTWFTEVIAIQRDQIATWTQLQYLVLRISIGSRWLSFHFGFASHMRVVSRCLIRLLYGSVRTLDPSVRMWSRLGDSHYEDAQQLELHFYSLPHSNVLHFGVDANAKSKSNRENNKSYHSILHFGNLWNSCKQFR